MKVHEIDTFKFGLDTRRDVLSSQKGTLYTLLNAHINPGGEIEGRKAFVEYADVSIFDNVGASISTLTSSGSVATATSAAHGLSVGDWVKISGASPAGYNGEFQILTVPASNQFTFQVASGMVSPATGTIVFGDLGMFGLEATSVGLVVFGSALAFGSTPDARAEPVLEAVAPTGVTYQQLRHPSLYNDTTEVYARARHRMVRIVHSINYNGNAFAVALFSDGRRFPYYNGALVQHGANGIVMTGRTDLADLARDLERQVEAISGWLVVPNVDENSVAENGSAIVTSPKGDTFEAFPAEISSAGQLGIKLISTTIAGTVGIPNRAGFQITNFTGTWVLSVETDPGGVTVVTDLTGGAITGAVSISETAAAIARAVNDLSYVHGYTAQATVDHVWVYDTRGVDFTTPIRLDILTTTGVAVAPGSAPTTLGLSVTQSDPTGSYTTTINKDIQKKLQGNITCNVTGGTAPYTFSWQFTDQNQVMTIMFPLAQTATILFQIGDGTEQVVFPVPGSFPFTRSIRCTVTDSAATPISQTIHATVTLVAIILP